jgi:CHAT domain-containing protein/Flp pilus assembly protein TadD
LAFIHFSTFGQESWDQAFQVLQQEVSKNDFDSQFVANSYANTVQLAIDTYGKNHEAYVYTLIIGVRIAFHHEAYQVGLVRVNEQLNYLASLQLDYQYYGNALYNASQLYLLLGQTDEALQFAKQHADLLNLKEEGSEQHANALYEYANLLFVNEDPLALTALEKSLKALNQYPASLGNQYVNNIYYLGTLYFEKEAYDEALDFYQTVLDIYNDNGLQQSQLWKSVTYNNAWIYQNRNQVNEAIASYEELKQQLESDSEKQTDLYNSVSNNLGVLYQKTGNRGADDLIVTTGTDVKSIMNGAALAFQRGEYEQALEGYENAFKAINYRQFSDSLLAVKIWAQKALVWKEFGNIDSAKLLLIKTLNYPAVEKSPASEESIMVFNSLGDIYLSTGLIDSAAILLTQASDFASESAAIPTLLTFQINNSLGLLQLEKAQFKEANALFEQNLNMISLSYGDASREYAQTLNNLGAIAIEEGDYNSAENLFVQAGEIFSKLNPDLITQANLLKNLALIAHGKTDFQKADSLYTAAAELYVATYGEEHLSLLSLYPKMALVQLALGNYPQAEQYFRKVISIATANYGVGSISYANAISGMGLFYQSTGNFAQAEKNLVEAIALYELVFGKKHPAYITAIENLSSIYQAENKLEKALPLLEEALIGDSIVYGINHPQYAATLHNIASVYLAQERFAKAQEMYQSALVIDEKVYGTRSPVYASTQYNLAVLFQKTDQTESADSLFDKVATLRREILGEQHPDYIYTLYGWGLLKQTKEEVDTAYQLLNTAVDSYLFLFKEYFPSMSESEKAAFYHKVNPVFEAFKDFALENYQQIESLSKQLFDLQLNTKAMLLNASAKMRNKILNSNDQVLISAFNDWLQMKELAVQYYSYSREELEREGINLMRVEEEINSMEKALSLKSNVFNNAFQTDSLTWKKVKEKLAPNTAVLELVRVRKSLKNDSIIYAGLLLTDTSLEPEIIILQDGKKIEERWFKAYQNLIKYKVTDTLSYVKLWKWLDEAIPDGLAKLYVSPDGIYNKININTLYDKREDEFLLEKENIRIITSARDLLDRSTSSSAESDSLMLNPLLVLFGSPDFNLGNDEQVALNSGIGLVRLFNGHIPALPGTLAEVEAIDSLTRLKNWRVIKYTEAQATEIAIDEVQSPSILHIASHGFFKNSDDGYLGASMRAQNVAGNPLLRSGLLLAGATVGLAGGLPYPNSYEDGMLTAYETMNLNLEGTELVVLSACETGLGEIKNGEGVYGLQRAFIVAGAKNLIMSLWTVNDYTTQLLMTEFYKRWTQGEDRFTAFRNAQFKIKEQFPEPYYWAAFTIIGQ